MTSDLLTFVEEAKRNPLLTTDGGKNLTHAGMTTVTAQLCVKYPQSGVQYSKVESKVDRLRKAFRDFKRLQKGHSGDSVDSNPGAPREQDNQKLKKDAEACSGYEEQLERIYGDSLATGVFATSSPPVSVALPQAQPYQQTSCEHSEHHSPPPSSAPSGSASDNEALSDQVSDDQPATIPPRSEEGPGNTAPQASLTSSSPTSGSRGAQYPSATAMHPSPIASHRSAAPSRRQDRKRGALGKELLQEMAYTRVAFTSFASKTEEMFNKAMEKFDKLINSKRG